MVTIIKRGPGPLAAQRQKTLDAMDKLEDQTAQYGIKKGEARFIKFDQAAIAGMDRMFILDSLLKDPQTRIVYNMAKAQLGAGRKLSMEAVAEMMLGLVERGDMTIGMVDGKIRVGIARQGWSNVGKALRR